MSRPAWIYDGSPIEDPLGHGERAVRFLRKHRHPISGKEFQLDPWMERIVRKIYGPRWHDGSRYYRMVVAMVPRGAHKTTLGAALANLHLYGPEKVPLGQVALAACNRPQARIAFDEACGLIMARDEFANVVRIRDSRHEIMSKRSRSVLKAISADAATANGKTPAFVLFDEIHAWRDRRLYDTLRSGLNKTANTLGVVISQAGVGTENLASDVFTHARRVAADPTIDPRTLPILFETAKDADWNDETVWFEANPGLECSPPYPDLEGLRQMAREAEVRPALRDRFLNDHLNVWLDRSASPFVDMATWDAGADAEMPEPTGPVWIGVDLSSSGDLTSIVMAWRDDEREGGVCVRPAFFCPAENLDRREAVAGVPYGRWAKDGLLTPTPGEVVDLGVIKATIRALCARYDVAEIAFDPALSHGVMGELQDEGLPVRQFRQGAITMMPAIATLERLINGRALRHPGQDILDWNVSNVEVEFSPLGHITRFRKPSRHQCIDGAVAMTMAVQCCANGETGKSIYEDGGAREDGPLVVQEWDFAA